METVDIEFLIDTIVRAIVEDKDKIEISTVDSESSRIVEIKVCQENGDTGKVIGRKGRTVDAIRTIVIAATAVDKKRTIVQVVD